jgi:hypothetical protein
MWRLLKGVVGKKKIFPSSTPQSSSSPTQMRRILIKKQISGRDVNRLRAPTGTGTTGDAEGLIRRPEMAEWMGADKNFSEENRLSPKITTHDSHMNSPRSHSHNRPTNPRNKSKQVAKRKHTSPRSKGQANLPARDGPSVRMSPTASVGLGGLFVTLKRTVCK